jgi:hypothetical protein
MLAVHAQSSAHKPRSRQGGGTTPHTFEKPVAKVVDAASKLCLARLEVIDTILGGANPLEVMMVCAPCRPCHCENASVGAFGVP